MFCGVEMQAELEGSLEIQDDQITGSLRAVLLSECCGEEVADCYIEVEGDLSEFYAECIEEKIEDVDENVELEDYDPDFEVGETGGGRYKKNYRTVEADVVIKCGKVEHTITVSGMEQASAFEDLY